MGGWQGVSIGGWHGQGAAYGGIMDPGHDVGGRQLERDEPVLQDPPRCAPNSTFHPSHSRPG